MNLARAVFFATLVALAGCATAGDNNPPVTPHKVGSGSINASYSETVNLNAAATFYSSARYIGSIDNVGIDLYAASGTAACTVAVEVSNRYTSTSSPTDDTLWDTYAPTGFTAPASISGAVSNYQIELIPLSMQYERLKFVCSTGTTVLTITTQSKGG